MKDKEFKELFDGVAQSNGFEKSFGGWFKEAPECIVVLDLQKSNFGNHYELNIKMFIQGMFGNIYVKNKHIVNKDTGDVFRRQPKIYNDVFDLGNQIDDLHRKQRLENLFKDFIVPFSERAITKEGIKALAEEGEIFLLPAIRKELGL